jgi:hypothetical protein
MSNYEQNLANDVKIAGMRIKWISLMFSADYSHYSQTNFRGGFSNRCEDLQKSSLFLPDNKLLS